MGLSNCQFTSSDFQFGVEHATVYADFNEIVNYLHELSHEMKQLIPSYFGEDTMTRYMEFLNISNPSIFSEIIAREGLYYDTVKNLSDLLPSNATANLLGYSHESDQQGDANLFTWYKKFFTVQQNASYLAKRVPVFRNELLNTLCYLIEIHEFCNTIISKWSYPSKIPERKKLTLRKAHILAYLVSRIRNSPISFFIPEALDVWSRYLDLVDLMADILVVDALLNFQYTDNANTSLTRVIVATRWTISRLVALQTRNLQGI